MTNYFYIDAKGRKVGPVNDQRLKYLAAQGIIGQHTPMETDTGYKGVAGQIPGLFPVAPSPEPNPFIGTPPVAENSFSAPMPAVNQTIPQNPSVTKSSVSSWRSGKKYNPTTEMAMECGCGFLAKCSDGDWVILFDIGYSPFTRSYCAGHNMRRGWIAWSYC